MSPPRLRNTSSLIAALPPPLLSTIFSFADIPTDLGIFCRVCKQWRDSCHSPLAFAGQRLMLDAQTNPAVVAQWAPCFTTVRMLQLTGENLTEELLGSLKPHVSHVPHLRLLWYKQECADDEERICWFTTFAQTFCNLSRLDIRCDLTPKDEQRLLSCFVGHFPRLQRFEHFSHPQHGQNTTADTPSLISMLPSLTRLTHLHFYSHALLPQICDDVMLAIAEHCPLLTNLHLVRPNADINMPLTEAGVIAFASGCPHLTTFHLEDFSTTFRCYFPSTLLDTLLTHSSSLTHLHLPSPLIDPIFPVDDVNNILAKHAHVTRITTSSSLRRDRVYYSPHIRCITLSYPDIIAINTYLARNPALTEFSVHTLFKESTRLSCADFVDIKRRFPNIKRLVWQRDSLEDSAKTEARFVGGMDPFVYRVFF